MPIAPNYVIPQFAGGKPANEFSIGTTAKDGNGDNVSVIQTINGPSDIIQQANLTNTPPFSAVLGTSNQISISDVVRRYYRNYAAGTNLFGGGTATNYGLDALAGAQVLTFTIVAYPETPTQYHTANDATIAIQFDGNTLERNATNWHLPSPKLINVAVTVAGQGTTAFNTALIASNLTIIATEIRAPYNILVTVIDLYTRLTMTTAVVGPDYGSTTPIYYGRVPHRITSTLDPGVWYNDAGNTYFS